MKMTMIEQIQDYGYYIRDPRMEGFTQFGAKQKLYQALWEIEKQLALCPKFVGEEEWIRENKK